jgi:hypothetical protein
MKHNFTVSLNVTSIFPKYSSSHESLMHDVKYRCLQSITAISKGFLCNVHLMNIEGHIATYWLCNSRLISVIN